MPKPFPQDIETNQGQGAGRPGPPGPPGAGFSAGLDLTGTSTEQSVIGFRERPLSTDVPSVGDAYVFNGTEWVPTPAGGGGGFTAGGDLSGTSTSQEVIGMAGFPFSGAPSAGDVLQFDGTQWVPAVVGGQGQIAVGSVALLAAFASGALLDGTAAQVAGFDMFFLNMSPVGGATADGVNLIAASGVIGGLWVRQYNTPADSQFLSTLYVDASAGHDGARDPSSSGTPLKTLQEAFNRISRLGLVVQNITINYAGTGGESFDADLTGVLPAGSPVTITIVGGLTILATQTTTAFTAPTPTSNTRAQLSFPAAGYAVDEALQLVTGSSGDSVGWVTGVVSTDVRNTTNFFSPSNVVDNPGGGGGDTVNHVSVPNVIGNVSVRLPAGIQVVILECQVTGKQVASGDTECLLLSRCVVPNGDDGYGPVMMSNCRVGGIVPSQGSVTVGRDRRTFRSCYWTAPLNINGGANTVFAGSNTSRAIMVVQDATVYCQVASALADFSFWGVGSSIVFVIEVQASVLDLGFTTVWGSNTGGITTTFEVLAGGWVYYVSSAVPVATGPTFDWRCGTVRTGKFAASAPAPGLPVSCPNVPCGIVQIDTPQGVAGVAYYYPSLNANLGLQNVFATNPRKGSYRVTFYLSVITAGTSGTLAGSITYTDESGVAQTVAVATMAASIATAGGTGGQAVIECNGSTNPQWQVSGVVTPGSLVYSVRFKITPESDG